MCLCWVVVVVEKVLLAACKNSLTDWTWVFSSFSRAFRLGSLLSTRLFNFPFQVPKISSVNPWTHHMDLSRSLRYSFSFPRFSCGRFIFHVSKTTGCKVKMRHCNGSFALVESDSETDTDSMIFCCQ